MCSSFSFWRVVGRRDFMNQTFHSTCSPDHWLWITFITNQPELKYPAYSQTLQTVSRILKHLLYVTLTFGQRLTEAVTVNGNMIPAALSFFHQQCVTWWNDQRGQCTDFSSLHFQLEEFLAFLSELCRSLMPFNDDVVPNTKHRHTY